MKTRDIEAALKGKADPTLIRVCVELSEEIKAMQRMLHDYAMLLNQAMDLTIANVDVAMTMKDQLADIGRAHKDPHVRVDSEPIE